MYSCSCRVHFLFTFTCICYCTIALVSGNVKKSKYHIDIVFFLHSERLLIIFRFVHGVTCQAKAKISTWSHLLAIPERHKNNRPWISNEEKIQKN